MEKIVTCGSFSIHSGNVAKSIENYTYWDYPELKPSIFQTGFIANQEVHLVETQWVDV